MMDWINNFQLFLFDMDGLLVNTEELHYLAYKKMCEQRGVHLPWSFARYCQAAHYDATALRDQIYQELPALHAMEPNWDVLYAEKKQAVVDFVNAGAVHLMPGIETLLNVLAEKNIKRCVVTHSPDPLVNAVRRQNPLLDSIPVWITRHEYAHPKPHPECYLKAIAKLANPGERIIGFEDTPRGLKALMQTPAVPVLISSISYPEVPTFLKEGAFLFSSMEHIPNGWSPTQ